MSTNGQPDPITSEKDLINIMLEEYKTLRAEQLLRMSIQFQLSAVAGSALLTIIGIGFGKSIWLGLLLIVILAILFICGMLLFDNDMRITASHLKKIEADINHRAKHQLMSWETTSSIDAFGYSARAKRAISRIFSKVRTT